jgi:DNA transformation protein
MVPYGATGFVCMKSDSFKEFVLEQLSALEEVEPRYMFGDWGLYCGSVFFAIIADGRLYFKTDATSRSRYLKMGMGPFRPNAKQTLVTYYEVPVEIVEDCDALTAWAKRAIRSQKGSRSKKMEKSSA